MSVELLRYLWIDSLCIVQDDEADWREEAAKMSSYYSQAYITLAATMSNNADGGLFQWPKDIVLNDGSQTWCVRAMRHLQRATTSTAPLFQRGWIFQERLLSPRVLHFATYELCFECNAQNTCECKQDMPDQGWQIKQEYLNGPSWKNTDPTVADIWHRMVEAYCKLSLTKPADKLPALSGLADQMRSRRGSNYFAGLWDDTLLDDILWSVSTLDDKRAPKLVPWRAPSWSWASVADSIRYGLYPRLDEVYCTVMDVHCSWIGPSTTGELRTGHIILHGPTFQGAVRDGRNLYGDPETKKPVSGYFSPDYQLELGVMPVVLLRIAREKRMLGREYLLVLKKVDENRTEFERVGLFEFFPLGSRWNELDWERAGKQTIKII
ncbi:hypothetical protein K469DRAFT_687100 [Zopfia rhizophila CBS 207.26]|uniref:Heterokaryon incompatibility domain-containing protein n=1 Tax=Zopfia rhizophila CBS 207.26 TaxID=1314779 RepID=A0A6A6E8B4_9PEZI|nr:hypothetical protein K469DRAFT_687100 [Zopfia rhizophila CBS 207.26]